MLCAPDGGRFGGGRRCAHQGCSIVTTLEFLAGGFIVSPCQFTNFIAAVASGTARCWCVPPTGKGQNARIAGPRSSPKSFPCSRPPAVVGVNLPLVIPAVRAVAAVADAAAGTATEGTEWKRGWNVEDGGWRGRGLKRSGRQRKEAPNKRTFPIIFEPPDVGSYIASGGWRMSPAILRRNHSRASSALFNSSASCCSRISASKRPSPGPGGTPSLIRSLPVRSGG